MPAVPTHHTDTTKVAWDGGEQVKNLGTDYTEADLKKVFAWLPDGDGPKKGDCSLPHHKMSATGKPGDANLTGCQSAIGVLNGAMGGSDIPDADRQGVWDHLAAHLKDADETPAELASLAAGGPIAVEVSGSPLTPGAVAAETQGPSGRYAAGGLVDGPGGPGPAVLSGRDYVMPHSLISHLKTEAARMSVTLPAARSTMAVHQARFLDGVPGAARALYLDAIKVQSLSMPFRDVAIRAKPDGTGGSRLLFTGYASVTEEPYDMYDWLGPYVEIVRAGAFAKTLSEDPDTAFLLNHGGATMARTKPGTMRLSEDDIGLYVEADLDPRRSDVQIVQSGIEGGELDEMSFAFWITRGVWSPDYMQFDLVEVNIHKGDTSVVNYGANPATAGHVGLRTRQLANLARSGFPNLVRQAFTQRTGEQLAAADLGGMLHVLGLATGADDTPEETRAVLAQILGERAAPAAPDGERSNIGDPEAPPDGADREALRTWVDDRTGELRAGKALSAATMDTLAAVLDLIATADVAVDAAQPILAELMGVPNPDDPDQDASDGEGDGGDEPDGEPDDEGETNGKNANARPAALYQRQAEALKLTAPAARI
jgi:HK97 family phage prohead protease